MSERLTSPYDSFARRWLALAERRREQFIDICNSGRWRRYYSEAELRAESRRIIRTCDEWTQLVEVSNEKSDAPPETRPRSESSS